MDNIEIITLIYDFKKNDSILWVENNAIQLLISDRFKSQELRNTIIRLKSEIISFLSSNKIFSESDFVNKRIFKTNNQETVLSFAQERLWFVEQYQEGTSTYHMPALYELDSNADKEGIKYALQQIISRHEILRTTIAYNADERKGMQITHQEPLNIEEVKLSGNDDYNALIEQDINKPFDLSADYPIRAKFYTTDSDDTTIEDKTLLLITTHHIATDGWSVGLFEKELFLYYTAFVNKTSDFKLPALEIQYRDYAIWQRDYLSGKILEEQLAYWKTKLSGYQTLELPVDYTRPSEIDYKGAHFNFTVNETVSNKLRLLSKQHGITFNSLMLATLNILLSKYTGQDDIIIGSVNAGRAQRQTQDLIGFFVNTQVNRAILNKSQTFEELILQVHQDQIQAQLYQDLPFEKLIDELGVERDVSRHPVFQVMFGIQNFENSEKVSDQQKNYLKPFILEDIFEVEKFDLSFFIDDSQEKLSGQISYATSLFHPDTIAGLSNHYIHLLEQLAQSPNAPYSKMGLLDAAEYQKIVYDWNATARFYPEEKTLHEMFEYQASATPSAIALVFNNHKLTYGELNEKSNQLAREIRGQYQTRTGQSLKPDTLIALYLGRSLEMVIAILAILKSGGAYVPVDPGYPQDRIDYILEDTQAELILIQRGLETENKKLPQHKLLCVDLTEELYELQDKENLPQHSQSTNLAYVIYTSGTTGRPKGVMIEHKAFVQFIYNFDDSLQDKINDAQRNVLSLTNYVFDIFGLEYALPLIKGNTITLSSINEVRTEDILNNQIIQQTPSTLFHLANQYPNELSNSICLVGGEALSPLIANKLNSVFNKVINVYGPAETVIWSSSFEVTDAAKPYIGTPLFNEQMYVLDSSGSPVAPGVTGELYIGGSGLARGYLNRADLTRERFVANPFATASDTEKGYTRLYKTGDLVRWLSDGTLEYIGRNDDQVKIRGYRIEPGEIEHAIAQLEGIQQVCVVVKERITAAGSDKYLAAYYILSDPQSGLNPAGIQEKLLKVLPDYMVPGVLIALDSFPLTINGKLDKRALPDADFSSSQTEYTAPLTAIEKEVCEIWENLLGIEQAGMSDNFFKIGGNSILAIQVSHRMSTVLGCDVKVADVFKYKTIAQLLEHVKGHSQLLIPQTDAAQGALSFAQERLWFIEQYEQGTNAYHIPVVFELDTDTDKEGMKYALQQIVSRHEVLRSTIEQGENQQHGIQNVHDAALSIQEIDVLDTDDYDSLIRQEINRPFDLGKQYPIRVGFYTIKPTLVPAPDKILLCITTHHIASDGWSVAIFEKELWQYYQAYKSGDTTFRLPDLEIQYKDYAAWQRTFLTGAALENQLSYWKGKLAGYQTLELPVDHTRPTEIDYRGSHHDFILDKKISSKLRELAQQYGLTLNSVMLGSMNILLGKYTGQDDIVIGSAIANRHHRQTEALIGFFVNTQANRTFLNATQSFAELIQQVHQDQIEAQLHQDLPFEKLIDELGVERDASRHPVFQVMFGVQNFEVSDKATDDQKSYLKHYIVEDVYEVEKFDLSVFIDDSQEELSGHISYATSLFDADTIAALSRHYIHLLDQLTQSPETPYSEMGLLDTAEYQKIVYDWNATVAYYPEEKTLQDMFVQQAQATPFAVALVYENRELTYGDLNEKSNQLAREIREQYQRKTGESLKPDTLIALYLERSLEMVIAILAVLKSGGAYVPIDPGYPQDRIDYILQDTQAELILIQRGLETENQKLPQAKLLCVDLKEELYELQDKKNLPQYSQSTDLGYVIYTSGTTGKPKGVELTHRNLQNLCFNIIEAFDITPDTVSSQIISVSFDGSVSEIFPTLISGAILHIVSDEIKESGQLVHYIKSEKISHLTIPADLLESLDYVKAEDLKTIHVGGGVNSAHCLSKWSNECKVINAYGPTEGTVCSTMHVYKHGDLNTKIGRPIDNAKVYVLDQNHLPVPIGVVGELHIGGTSLAKGYLNNIELTEKKFITNNFATPEDLAKGYTRLYKTGDLVRWLADGNLEYLGRNDDQVKIRGYRIELSEIENAMLQIQGVKQVFVTAKERNTEIGSTRYLTGYYVQNNDHTISTSIIQQKLSEVLPDYMVPSVFIEMDLFPLTINGKLDKQAFPDPDWNSSKNDYAAPVTELEKELCQIWESVLNIDKIGVTDNFFRIGGDSILSIQVSSRIRQAGFNCQVKDIFECKTIAALSIYLLQKQIDNTVNNKTEQGRLTGELGLLPIQKWFLEKVNTNQLEKPNHWNQSFLIKVPVLDTAKLETVIEDLVNYHDVLRVKYQKETENETGNSNWKPFYQPNNSFHSLKTLDVSKQTENELEETLTSWQSDFDLEQGILFQIGYLYGYQDGSARLYFALHHMIVDGVSWRILAEDFKNLYEGRVLPDKGSSYRQWVETVTAYTEKHSFEEGYWEEQLQGLPNYNPEDQAEPTEESFEIEEFLTSSLLKDASKAYHTEVNDLLLTAFAFALQEINDQDIQGITLEGHGREDIDSLIDHSHTVGWFTTMLPVRLAIKSTVAESIKGIKESLRNIPNKGIGFGAFATSKKCNYTYKDLAPITFNYLGQFDTDTENWSFASESSGNSVHKQNLDTNIININGHVANGKINFSTVTKLGKNVTKQLSESFKSHLISIINHCKDKIQSEGSSYTPSDFKTVNISQHLLDKLEAKATLDQNEIINIYPANSLQQGFIYHAVSHPQDDAYRVQLSYDYKQALNVAVYVKAWEHCIAQYPVLRTAFNWDEEIIQVIYKYGILNYKVHDISNLATQEEKDAKIASIQIKERELSFDLTQPNLLRLHIIKQSNDYYTIVKTEHHSISDGWSGPILLENVNKYYQEVINNKKIALKEDSAYLQTQEYIKRNKKSVEEYWKTALSQIESANDINALLSKSIDSTTYNQVEKCGINTLKIEGELYNRLKIFTNKEGITTNVMLQFIWHKLLHVYSNNLQTIVGTTISGRELPVDGIEESVGLYINTLPLIVNWEKDNTVLEQLQQIQKGIKEINTHSFADLAKLQKKGERLFHSLFIFENYPISKAADGNQESIISLRNFTEKVDYPLSITSFELGDEIHIKLNYDSEYLAEDKAEDHLVTLKSILEQVLENPDKSHRKINLLQPAEFNKIIYDWNATEKEYPQNKTIQEMFEEQFFKTPNTIALVYEGTALSYKELNEKSNQLARQIRSQYLKKTGKSMQPDTLIALCLEKNLEMIIGILAVLKAGGAYVPIDPNYPQERIDYVLSDAQIEVILIQKQLEKSQINLPDDKVIHIDLEQEFYKTEDKENLLKYSTAKDLAYVIYTSGTTGKPKGVMVEHSAFSQFIYNFNDSLLEKTASTERNLLSLTNYVFDIFGLEYALPLTTGSIMTLSSVNTVKKEDFLNQNIIQQTPSSLFHLVNQYADKEFSNIICLVGGEALQPSVATRLISSFSKVINVYGPAETVIWSSSFEVTDSGKPYIGTPLFNEKMYVLDAGNVPVPIGVIGELYIGGTGVGRGYLNRAELTKERFIANPFATEADKSGNTIKLYKTGDLVRWLRDGNIEFMGRNDDQLKIRGHRIELGEIEHAMAQIEGIKQVCVLAKERTTQTEITKYLVGYYIHDANHTELDQKVIQETLAQTLPDYMIPLTFIALDSFPLTVNGKLDKRALPDPEVTWSETLYTAPVTEDEKAVCKIWQALLGLDKIGITDDFFRIGGNSILALQVSHHLSQLLKCDIKVADIFKLKTIKGILETFALAKIEVDGDEWEF